MSRAKGSLKGILAALLVLTAAGCAKSVREIPRHAQQERLERLVNALKPHTSDPEVFYWIRVAEPMENPIGLAVLYQRHIYIAESLLKQDDAFLTGLIAHGMAHHLLHHQGKREILKVFQKAAFKVGGFFIPGLSHGWRVTDPLAQVAASTGQERMADDSTVEFLTQAGFPDRLWLDVLESIDEQGYGERVGSIGYRGKQLTNRIERMRLRFE